MLIKTILHVRGSGACIVVLVGMHFLIENVDIIFVCSDEPSQEWLPEDI